ncbi:MAG TPA: dTDP-4-dehydrorhamnose reductase [Chitinophagaceae bacterium]|nr:dTDP-4-dehydrorhamnose reductase [Chitinophagaceae bacterium]
MNTKPVILVSGKNGQLGSELADIAAAYPQFEFYFFDREGLDIGDKEQVAGAFNRLRPQWFINCAAYTAVDKAETEKEKSLAINAKGPADIATLCNEYKTKLVHISTDYVFNGEGTAPYKEDEPAQPVNYYGETKLLGEKAALANNANTVIIRTSWVYSAYGHNFVKTMLRLMKERPEIKVVSDQVGSPTYAADLADAIMHIITSPVFIPGIYHFSNDGIISWYDFATAIKDIKQLNAAVHPIPTTAYPTPAKRPAYSAMSKTKIVSNYHITLKGWKDSLQQCLKRI